MIKAPLYCSLLTILLLVATSAAAHAQQGDETPESHTDEDVEAEAVMEGATSDDAEDDAEADEGIFIMDLEVVDGTIDMPEAEYILTPTVVEPGPLPAYTELGRSPRAGEEGVPDRIDPETDVSENEAEGDTDSAAEPESTETLDD